MKSTSNFASAIKKFAEAGIHRSRFIPIIPQDAQLSQGSDVNPKHLGKAPGAYNAASDTWGGLYGSRIINHGLDKADYNEFKNWPTPNAGLLGAFYPAIDSDAESPAARLLIEGAMLDTFGTLDDIPERIRGTADRRLYVFENHDMQYPVRGKHINFTLGGIEHKIDVSGQGQQYVVCGTHPSGDEYRWNPKRSLADPDMVARLVRIEDADITRFIEHLKQRVEEEGGTWGGASAGKGGGVKYDPTKLPGTMKPDMVRRALALMPNRRNGPFHGRNEFVGIVAAIKAALGVEGAPEASEIIEEWATKPNPLDPEDNGATVWCPPEFLEKIYDSIDRDGVTTSQGALDAILRKNGVTVHVSSVFEEGAAEAKEEARAAASAIQDDKTDILRRLAETYVFCDSNILAGKDKIKSQMRNPWNPAEEAWHVVRWLQGKESYADPALVEDALQHYRADEIGAATLVRDLKARHPECFFVGTMMHPNKPIGDIIMERERGGAGKFRPLLNLADEPETITLARTLIDQKPTDQDRADVNAWLTFGKKLFGEQNFKYELDTLAYMAQTGDRPGALLFIIGDGGVGKSLWMELQANMFCGIGGAAYIDGAKFKNEGTRRWSMRKSEGKRIIVIRELPETSKAHDMVGVTSALKQMVDPGSEGDYLEIEPKGVDARDVPNFARFLASSNFANAMNVEDNIRRIFYVVAQITEANKLPKSDYDYLGDKGVLKNPRRLAAILRYLMVEHKTPENFDRNSEPPMSGEKQGRIAKEIHDPVKRHCRAALSWLQAAQRKVFDATELKEIMTRVADNEYSNTGLDERRDYVNLGNEHDKNQFRIAVIASMPSFAVKPAEIQERTAKGRSPTIYVMKTAHGVIAELAGMDKEEKADFIREEKKKGIGECPIPDFADPEDL